MLFGEAEAGVAVAGQVADDPDVVHPIAGSRDLGMGHAVEDLDRVVAPHPVDVVPQLGVAVALGQREAVVVDLRLRVMVGRVARPPAGIVDDLAQDEVGLPPVGVVEDQPDVAQARALDESFASVLGLQLLRSEELRGESALVGRADDRPLRSSGVRA